MNDLDDLELISAGDPQGFLRSVEEFPEQIRDARRRAAGLEALPDPDDINGVVVLGMGGSGISGDAVRAVLGPSFNLPIATLKGYELPGWVSKNTLVFAMSYSGNTEETLATFEEAGARRWARIVIVTTGGDLAKWGNQFEIPTIEVPPGLQPRAAFGYLTIPILLTLERMGLASGIGEQVDEALDLLTRRSAAWGREVATEGNDAKRLARRMVGKVPIVYGSEGIAEVAAYRWKCQLNECAKVPAWWHTFPELNHNEVVGWNRLKDLTAGSFAMLVLRHSGEHPRIRKRIEVTLPAIRGNVAVAEEVWAEGSSPLARLFDLVYFGDFVATYLALAQGVDPAPVDVIGVLKDKLKEG